VRPPAPVNGLSVDLEDWYQVSDFDEVVGPTRWERCESRLRRNTERVLGLLDRHGVKATFFVLAWNAEREPALVKEVRAAGHEIASHGFGHRLIYRQSVPEFTADLDRSLRVLEAITGEPVRGYRAPSFSITPRSTWALDVLLARGLDYDASVFPIRRGLYGLPDAPRFPHVIRRTDGHRLVEFPVSTVRLAGWNAPFSGGAYLRVLPGAVVARCVAHLNARGLPVVVYFHPWELDPGQPRLHLRGRRTMHYVNLGRTESRLDALLERFRFTNLGALLDGMA
jgi:polysaccharide deacetylase family protein (PEP-CTERM system associated)